jgi:two-component system chemotaxis response regulator CheB
MHVVAIGASAGGIEPLLTAIGDLPPNLPAAVLVVVHVPKSGPSALPRIISRSASLPARHARDGEPLRRGEILVAPPDHHLTIDRTDAGEVARVRHGPAVNRSRPAIDPLFQSVALHAGSRGVGVVLSGSLDDGAAGLAAIAAAGGVSIVQDPTDAVYPSMPEAALDRAVVQYRLPAERIGATIVHALSMAPTAPPPALQNGRRLDKELSMSELRDEFVGSDELGTDVSVFGCPACGGTLWELREGEGFRFRCRIGHAYSPQTLLESQGATVEDALWMAVRALDEQASLATRLAEQARRHGRTSSATRFEGQAGTAEEHARAIRELIRVEPAIDASAASDLNPPTLAEVAATNGG